MSISTFERLASTAEMAVEMDRRGSVIEKLEAEVAALNAAARKALNFIENTESELGMKLSSGDALRAALGGQHA